MAIFCSHCGTKLEDFMKFCYNCGNPPKGAPTVLGVHRPKPEYTQVIFNMSQKPFIQYHCGQMGNPGLRELTEREIEPEILEKLKPHFDGGWQLDGTFKAAVSMIWKKVGFLEIDERLIQVIVRLVRYL